MDFKWIGFVIKWIINGLDWSKSGLDQEKYIFCPPLDNGHIQLLLSNHHGCSFLLHVCTTFCEKENP